MGDSKNPKLKFVLRKDKIVSLRKASFRLDNGQLRYVAYAILSDKCTFTGLQPSWQGATTSFVEEIVDSICRLEGVNSRAYRFFDLQSDKMFRRSMYRGTDGSFQYDEVILEDGEVRWQMTECPQEIIIMFCDHIGLRPMQVDGNGRPVKKDARPAPLPLEEEDFYPSDLVS